MKARSAPRRNIMLFAFSALTGAAVTAPTGSAQAQTVSTSQDSTAASKQAKSQSRTATSKTASTTSSRKATLQKAAATSVNSTRTESVVVTGTLFHDENLSSASPIEQITAKQLQQRGIKTVTDALQLLSSNGSGNLTNAFSANGAFAGGASAPSLRGLQTSATLVMMDGMRLSYYPAGDDGARNFVDTNWMPASLVQTIDVQQDGGSALYGADAVAGVINMITREQIKGFEGNAEGGLNQGGYGGHQRLYANYGVGDVEKDGYNFYVNSEYQSDDMITNSQLGYPYNTSNLTGIGGGNADGNILGSDGTFSNAVTQTTGVVAKAVDSSGKSLSGYQLLNPTSGCNGLSGAHSGYVTGTPTGSVSSLCQQDTVSKYSVISPYDRRVEATAHLTVKLGPRAKLVSMFTYSQNLSYYTGTPSAFYANTQSQLGTSKGVLAPAYLPDGSLNPNNPYASLNESAQLYGRFIDPTEVTQFSQNYRGSMHLTGWEPSSWGGDWNYDSSMVGMNTDLSTKYGNYINIGDLNNAIENGTYNFVDQSANSTAAKNAIAPTEIVHSKTEEYSWQASVTKGLVRLPGGMLNLAIGTNVRYEGFSAPNANPVDTTDVNNQYESINPFSAIGHRYVYSGYFELNAPIVKMLNADFQGRYDSYSTGFSHFSPKIGVTFKPSKEFMLRGTWSQGFQVPSFYETNGTTIGYTSYGPSNLTWINQHLDANGSKDSYAQAYSLGGQSVGNPDLKPMTNNTFTGGPVFHPFPWMTFSAEYWYIREKNVIVSNPTPAATVAAAYEAMNTNQTVMIDGNTVVPDIADPLHPDAPRRAGIIESSYINANSMMTDGVDLNLSITHRLPGPLKMINWYSNGHATWVHRFNQTIPGVGVERFAGTEGPWNTTSASGTPRWRANWQNTFTWNKLSTTFTVYYTSGYHGTAEDNDGPGTAGNCNYALYQDVSSFYPSQCNVRHFWDLDMTVNYQFNKQWAGYVNIYNLPGFKAPYDFGTYGSYLYNSSWAQSGAVGRAFRFGVTATL